MTHVVLTIPNQQTLFDNDLTTSDRPATVLKIDLTSLETSGVTFIQINIDGKQKSIVAL
jgi:spore germination protein GerM